jgi:hexosaminidase
MPEFDIPGHSRSSIACYKDLACFQRDLPVATHWGVKFDVLCVGKNSTMQFVKDVIDELCELFPYKYIHIGGDEVPKHRWNLCPNCQAKIKELGLSNSEELQMWFMNEVKKYCVSKGKEVFMWNWDLKEDTLLDSDLGFTKCSDTKTDNRKFIDTSTNAYYIDLPYGYISLKDTSNHNVYTGNCLGIEATLWSEFVPNMKKADFMIFPRLAPICETAWNGECSWDKIKDKIDFYYSYLDKNSYGYAPLKKANPNKLRRFFQILWFERRQLTWEGLTNIIDNKKIEKIAKTHGTE